MPKYKTKEEVEKAVKDILVDKGVDENSAGYLAELYADSERGKANISGDEEIAPAASCSTGIIPIF